MIEACGSGSIATGLKRGFSNTPLYAFGPCANGNGNAGFKQNFYDQWADRSILTYDVQQRVIINDVLDLLFGNGREFAFLSGPAGAFVSDWCVNGITEFQSGFPMPLTSTNNNLTNDFWRWDSPLELRAGCNKKGSDSQYQRFPNNNWFNTVRFAYPGDSGFGYEPRVDGGIHLQDIYNFDFAFLKTTKIREGADLQFRAESLNISNHPQFSTSNIELDGDN